MGFHNYTIPVVRANLLDGAQLQYVNVPLGTWQTGDLIDGGLAYGLLLAYLTDVWKKTCMPEPSTVDTDWIPIEGEGFYTFADTFLSAQISVAEIRIESAPQDIDLVFGANPIAYVGQCAFGKKKRPFEGNPLTGMVKSETSNVLPCYQLEWINWWHSIFTPRDVAANSFWWHLKPGVRGHVRCRGLDLGRGIGIDCLTMQDNPEIPICQVNPLFWVKDLRYPPTLDGPPDGPGG